MTEPNVAPYIETADTLGIPAKSWLVKAAKSKTIWFSTALAVFGALETFLPTIQTTLGSHSGEVLAGVGFVTAILRFATTSAIADK